MRICNNYFQRKIFVNLSVLVPLWQIYRDVLMIRISHLITSSCPPSSDEEVLLNGVI